MAATTDPWIPTVEDVSLLLRTRTVGRDQPLSDAGWLGGDTGPAEVTVFDDTTRPTDVEVEKIVDLCAEFAQVQIPVSADLLPDLAQGTLKYIIALYAAVQIEVSFFRETANQDLIALWTGLADRALRSLQGGGAEDGVGAKYTFGTLRIGTPADEQPEIPLMPADLWTPWGWDPFGPAFFDGAQQLETPGTVPRRRRTRG